MECLHDRVRELVLEPLSSEVRGRSHLALAEAAAQGASADPEFLAHHFRGAGRLAEAAAHAELAGDRAIAMLALDQAARMYMSALECRAGERPAALLVKLADTLASVTGCVASSWSGTAPA